MTDNVIRPPQFRNGPRVPFMSQKIMTGLYSTMMNLYYSANNGCLSNARLVAEMVKQTGGMNGPDTMACASIVGNNAIMLEKIRDCLGELMKVLVLESADNLPLSGTSISQYYWGPDDQPPAA